MPLEAMLDSIDGLPEEIAGEYEKTDDGYQLKVLKNYVPKDRLEDTTGLKSALKKEREAAATAARQLKAMQEKYGGIDIDEWEKLQEERREHEEREAERKGEWEKLKAQMREQHQKELAAREQNLGRMKGELERHLIDAAATAAINEANGNVILLLPHVKSRVQLIEDNGTYKPQVVDESGTPRVDGDGNPLSIKALVSEMRTQEVYAGAFKGTGSAGGGTPPADGGEGNPAANGGGKPPENRGDLHRDKMTLKDKVEFIKKHGNEAFLSLPR